MHSGNGYIDDIVDKKGLEDIKRTLNMEEEKDEWKEEIINDKDNKWGNGSIKQDEQSVVEQDEDEDDDFGF